MKINHRDIVAGLFLVLMAAMGLWLNQDHSMGSARRMGPGYMPWMVFLLQAGLGAMVILVSFGKRGEKVHVAAPEGIDVVRILSVVMFAAALGVLYLAQVGGVRADKVLTFTLLAGATAAGAIALWIRSPEGEGSLRSWTPAEFGSFIAAIVVGFGVWYTIRGTAGFIGTGYNAVGISMLAGFLVLSIPPGWRFLGLICACMCIFGLTLERLGFYIALTGTILLACLAERDHLRKPLGVLGLLAFLLLLCWFVFIRELDIRVNLWPT